MSSSVVTVAKAPCGCASVLFHLATCRTVHGELAKMSSDRVFVDVEDGCVWLHVGDKVASMTSKAARALGDQMHACAQEVERCA